MMLISLVDLDFIKKMHIYFILFAYSTYLSQRFLVFWVKGQEDG